MAFNLHPADVLMFRGTGFVSWRIRTRGRGPYTHAALLTECALSSSREWLVAEVREWYGGRLVTLGSQVQAYPGQIDVFRYTGRLNVERAAAIQATMRGFAGRRYAYWRVLQAGLLHTWLLSAMQAPTLEEAENGYPGPLFCSQAVSLAFWSAGIDLVPRLASQWTEPADLARSGLLDLVGTLES